MRELWLIVFAAFLAAGVSVDAQNADASKPSREELASHLMSWVPPVYPAIAQASGFQGEVVVKVEVGPDGLVRSAKAVSGSSLLYQATTDAVKQWRYVPFHIGSATIAVEGEITVVFSLHGKPEVHTAHEAQATGSYSTTITLAKPDNSGQPDAAIADRFNVAWELCSRGVIAHAADAGTIDSCKKASAIADEFAADRRYTERRRVNVYAATALANAHDLAAAIPYAEKAVLVVKLGHDDDSGSEAAFATRGQLRAFSGDMKGGDEDLSIAEGFARKMANSGTLKKDLLFHAELLERMNRPADAKAKRNEASKL